MIFKLVALSFVITINSDNNSKLKVDNSDALLAPNEKEQTKVRIPIKVNTRRRQYFFRLELP